MLIATFSSDFSLTFGVKNFGVLTSIPRTNDELKLIIDKPGTFLQLTHCWQRELSPTKCILVVEPFYTFFRHNEYNKNLPLYSILTHAGWRVYLVRVKVRILANQRFLIFRAGSGSSLSK